MPGINVRLDSVARRRVMLGFYSLLLAGVALVVLIVVLIWSSSKHDDRLAVIANFLAGGTLLLALLAGFVALQAYAAATGLPDLRFRVQFADLEPNVLTIARPDVVLPAEVSQTNIRLHNTSKYSARNPAVVVRLLDSGVSPDDEYRPNIDWVPVDSSDTGGVAVITAFQWDGGPTDSIHGEMTRSLPVLNLKRLYRRGDNPMLQIEFLAEGYVRRKAIPLIFFTNETSDQPPSDLNNMPEWL